MIVQIPPPPALKSYEDTMEFRRRYVVAETDRYVGTINGTPVEVVSNVRRIDKDGTAWVAWLISPRGEPLRFAQLGVIVHQSASGSPLQVGTGEAHLVATALSAWSEELRVKQDSNPLPPATGKTRLIALRDGVGKVRYDLTFANKLLLKGEIQIDTATRIPNLLSATTSGIRKLTIHLERVRDRPLTVPTGGG